MNLYEVNKQAYKMQKDLTIDQVYNFAPLIRELIAKDTQARVYMILCHDTHYYTLYEKKSSDEEWVDKLPYEVIEDVIKRGKVKGIEIIDEKNNKGVEFWIQENGYDEPNMYFFFDYTNGIIEV